ncbi:hypothetical protein FRC02_011937 [Tulasnella sp. 418]|nr:hypothetical protein FRC02_011937 [Tulasnella sp. 418]
MFPEDTLGGTKFNGFSGALTKKNHNGTSTIISASLPSASTAANGSRRGVFRNIHFMVFRVAFVSLFGVISALHPIF